MNNFYSHFKVFKWAILCFTLLILVIVLPIKIQERNYIDIFIVTAIAFFILLILFGLNVFFSSLAINFNCDNSHIYLRYANKKMIAIAHSEIQKIQYTSYKYVIHTSGKRKFYISRIIGLFTIEKEVSSKLTQLYPGMIKNK